MKFNTKIKKIIIGVILFGKFRDTIQLSDAQFGKIINNYPLAIECFRNPSRDNCSSVKSYMLNLKYIFKLILYKIVIDKI